MNGHDPITQFMLNNEISAREFAKMADVTPQVIRRAAQGLFGQLPPSLESVMMEFEPRHMPDWKHIYAEWLEHPIGPSADVLPELNDPTVKTFVDWRYRINSSKQEFCRMFRVQPIIIANYETGKTENLPVSLRHKLLRMYGEEYLLWVAGLPANSAIMKGE